MSRYAMLLVMLSLNSYSYHAVAESPTKSSHLDQAEAPDPNYVGPVFKPSFDFPPALPAAEPHPWEKISFKLNPELYMAAVLQYALEGQDRSRWAVEKNPVRKWYHAPWMGPGGKGREYINGLTSERRSQPKELGPNHTKCRQNWAVGFYNPLGGYTLGRFWAPIVSGTSQEPDYSALPFPPGTVVVKFLYTQADTTDLSSLSGAPTIQARIIEDPNPDDDKCPADNINGVPAKRIEATLRLLQVDIGVRDSSANDASGWVFGTFFYDGTQPGSDPWKKLRPVGLMWGNDHALTDEMASNQEKPKEGIVLSTFDFKRNFGRGGRMNGPVDNPNSSCLSCHMTAQKNPPGMTAPDGANWSIARCWFRTLKPTEAFGMQPSEGECGEAKKGQASLDYSLQLSAGLRNYEIALANTNRGGIEILGTKFFQSPLLSPDQTVKLNGLISAPISREGDK